MADGRVGLVHKAKFWGLLSCGDLWHFYCIIASPSPDGGRLAWAELRGEKD